MLETTCLTNSSCAIIKCLFVVTFSYFLVIYISIVSGLLSSIFHFIQFRLIYFSIAICSLFQTRHICCKLHQSFISIALLHHLLTFGCCFVIYNIFLSLSAPLPLSIFPHNKRPFTL